MEWPWQPIETAPASSPDDDDQPRLVLWIADGGVHGRGCAAFGYVYTRRRTKGRIIRAEGFIGDWQITHWMPEISGPNPL